MPRFRVPTDAGTFEVETDVEDPTEEELLALIEQAPPEAEEPGLARRGAAFAARVGAPIVGGALGLAGGPLVAAGGAAVGGAAGEVLAEMILGEELDPTEVALSAGLAAIPAGPAARLAARPGITLARRAALTAAEGAAQGALAIQAESIVREGEPAGIAQTLGGAAGGALLGAGLGTVAGRAARAKPRPALTPEVPLSPQTEAAEAVQEAQGTLFRRVPGLAGEVPPRSPIPDSRLDELQDSVDRLFPHLGEVEKLSLKSTIAEYGEEILQHSRSVQSVERTDALAQELVFDLSKPLPSGTALNAEQLRHVVNLVSPLQERVTTLAGEVAARPGDDALKLKLQHASTRLTNIILSYSGARAEAGRSLNILRQQAKALATGDAKAILAAQKMGVDAETIAKIIAASPDDPVSQYRQLRDMARPDWKAKLKWYYYSNILSGPQTHVRNLVSNVVNLSLRPVTTPIAAAVDVVGARLGRREREVFAGEAPIAFLQMYRALPEAWNKMSFMFRNGFSLSDVHDFEVRPAEMPGGIATNVIGRALAAGDEFFRAIGFSMEMHAGAFARARRQALREGLDGREMVDRTSALTAELLDRKPSDLIEQAETFSRRVTFQEQDNAVAKALIRLRDVIPGGAFLVPFVRTPANIFRQGLQFSPAGLLMPAPKGRVGAQRRAEAALGSMLLAPVAWLAATEQITGAAPTDAGERDAFYAAGKRPNSIRIGDQWVSYAELGPLVLPFAIVANAADAWRKTGGELSPEMVGTIVGQVGRSTLEQSYLASLSAVFQALEDPQRYGQAFLQNLAAGLIPAVGLQRNITRATDPLVRQATTFEEGLARNVPVLSPRLFPKLDAFGEPVERQPGGAAALVVPQVVPARTDALRAELSRLGLDLDPLRRVKHLTVGDKKVPLDPAADFALRRATGTFRRQFLADLFADPEYQAASDEEKAAAIRGAVRDAGELAGSGARDLLAAGEPVTFEALTADAAPAAEPEAAPAALSARGPRTELDPLFAEVGNRVGVDPSFLKAVAKVESDFNPAARGPATRYGTAIGLMQILPSTFKLYEARARELLGYEPSIEDPEDNLLVGALYYRDLLDQVDNDPEAAAKLYHGGPDPRNHGPNTRAYGAKIAATYASFTEGT